MTPPPLSYELAWNRDGTQAFCLRRHLAVQFHPEATTDVVAVWSRSDGVAADLDAPPERTAAAEAAAYRLFDAFAADLLG